MGAPKIDVSARYPATENDWRKTATLENKKDSQLYFRITPNSAGSIQLFFPVYNPGNLKPALNEAITDNENWGRESCCMAVLQPQTTDDDIRIEKISGSSGYLFDITIPPEITVAIILKLDIKTLDQATAILEIQYYNEEGQQQIPTEDQPKITIAETPKQPIVEAFKTSRAVLIEGVADETKFVLSWKVADAKKVEITVTGLIQDKVVDPEGTLLIEGLTFNSACKLVASYGALTAEKTIDIQYRSNTGVYPVDSFRENKLMNLINGGDKMFALVKNDNGTDVLLWHTSDGVNWEKSDVVSFKNNKTPVPLGFAGSSSVFCDNKIYLIGGSRFDLDFKSNDSWFLDLNNKSAGWRVGEKSTFSPRMGHAVVVYQPSAPLSKPAIWVIGGIGPQGTLNDVHIFEADKWRSESIKMPNGLCLHSAIVVGNTIEVYGGFSKDPAELDQTLKKAIVFDIVSGVKTWKPIAWPKETDPNSVVNKLLLSCNAGLIRNEKFFFTIFKDRDLEYGIYGPNKDGVLKKKTIADEVMIPEYFAATQAVAFNNLIWFCSVKDDGVFISKKLYYFLVKPSLSHAKDQ